MSHQLALPKATDEAAIMTVRYMCGDINGKDKITPYL